MASPTELSPLKRALIALDEMKGKLDAADRARNEPIAIVGMSCRFPGGSHGADAFWDLLRTGRNAVTEVPKDRWNCDDYYDTDPTVPGKAYGRWGAFLDGIDRFDPQFFGIAPREAAGIDPQQRLLLETTWEALEDAGTSPEKLQGVPAGVFVGINSIDYATLQLQNCDLASIDAYSLSGSAHSIAAGRLAYVLGLQGPAMAVDTACSSSLVAIHLACQSLRNDDCRVAVAGGVHVTLTPINMVVFSKLRMLAADGKCKTFDGRGDGFVEGEGCAVIVLKRLSHAIADKDRILALVRGSAVNQDGASSGLTAPNGPAQEAVIRAALKRAGVQPAEVGYVEAHGTGTSLGDPIEVQALAAVLGEGRPADRPLQIGSVKTNIGHTQAAAGIAGLVKLVLALQHKEIPPNLHFEKPNPFIPWPTLPVEVVTSLRPWAAGDMPRVGGVSSFGFSGTNVHVVVGEAPAQDAVERGADRPLHIVTLSARSEGALQRVAARWRDRLAAGDDDLRDVAFTANAGRAHLAERAALIAGSTDELRGQLDAIASGQAAARTMRMRVASADRPRLAFLFTGQGAQYAGMGRELYDTQPTFRAAIDRCDTILRPLMDRPLISILFPAAGDEALVHQTACTQPALFAIEYALAELWRSWGIVPAAVMGHSIGEYVAALLAGVFSLEDALTLVAARGRLMQSLPAGGAMAAVFASESVVKAALASERGAAAIAAVNGPEDIVISGPDAAVTATLAQLQGQGVSSERLTVSHAFHSALMDPILDEFEKTAAAVKFSPPRMTLVSNLTGQPIRAEIATAAYWRRHLREAVRFADGARALYDLGYRVFLELGPRPTLSGLARRSVPDDAALLPSLRKAGMDWARMLETLAELYGRGADIDWAGFDRDYVRYKLPMPKYAFERERHWLAGISADASRKPGQPGRATGHPLLGTRISSALEHVQFDVELGVDAPAYLTDHRKRGAAVFPATAYLEMGLSAAREVLGSGSHVFEELVISDPLVLGDDRVRVQTVLTPGDAGTATFRLFSLEPDSAGPSERWRQHGMGTIRIAPVSGAESRDALDAIKLRCTDPISVDDYYASLIPDGHEYGPTFRGVTAMWRGNWEALAEIALPDAIAGEAALYRIHPALLDASMQPLAAAVPAELKDSAKGETYLPVSLGRVRVHLDGASAAWSHVTVRVPAEGERDGFSADIRLYAEDGRVVAEIEDVYHKRISADAMQIAARKTMASWLYEVGWREKPIDAPATAESGAWLILAATEPGAKAAVGAFAAKGITAIPAVAGSAFDPDSVESLSTLLAGAAADGGLRGIVHMLAADAPPSSGAPGDAVRRNCGSLLHLTQAIVGSDTDARPRVVVVTRGATAAGNIDVAVDQAPLWALTRTVAVEHADLRCRSIDLDRTSPGYEAVVAESLASGSEDQIAYREGRRLVARLARSSAAAAVAAGTPAEQPPVTLEIGARGMLDRLETRPMVRREPGPGEVEIEVAVSGLNFRDVLNALGMYEGEPGPLGSECSGTVVRVGDGVTHLREGDAVFGMAPASFSTYVTAPAGAFVRKPASLSLEEAATIPVAFLTAEYALTRLAQLKRGERVLIHAAAGGVGLAAVQIAQRAGAEIFATAGSPDKHAYLRALGVQHIMSSRTLDFSDEILRLTNGEGVHVVLNSLANEFVGRSVAALAEGGRFLEIGKAGIWTEEQMAAARPDATYFPIYFRPDDHPAVQRMYANLLQGFADGTLKPLNRRVFAMADASEAFRFMAQAKHIGKVLVRVAPGVGAQAAIRPDATYLVTGGFGALGLAVADRLIADGARHLVLAGRGGPDDAALAAIERWRSAGALIVPAKADISRGDDALRLLTETCAGLPPLRGIVHAAGVLDDGLLVQQSWPRFEKVMAPKLAGAWNLHVHSRGMPLDFFVLFSSMVSLFGAPGQGNYAAANAFLDGLAQHRRAQGLPGLSINWGPWAGAGMAGRVSERDRQRWKAEGYGTIPPGEGAGLLLRLVRQTDGAGIAVLPIDWQVLFRQFTAGQEPPMLAELASGFAKPAAAKLARRKLAQELEGIAPNRRRAAVAAYLHAEALKVLGLGAGVELDPRQPLSELGLDSLMAVELRNAIAGALDRTLPATLLFKHPALDGLTDFVMTQVGGDGAADGPSSNAAKDTEADALAAMSDEEAKALLAQELETLTLSGLTPEEIN